MNYYMTTHVIADLVRDQADRILERLRRPHAL
jgi:hypothetical protein